MSKLPSIRRLEISISVSATLWPGRCYEIASMVVESGLVSGKAVYGHWLGPIAPGTHFRPRGSNTRPFTQHGWIRSGDQIIDPTRWVFEGVKPYLFAGKSRTHREYDEGGNALRSALSRPPPPFDTSEKLYRLDLPADAARHINDLLGDELGVCQKRLAWIANLPVQWLDQYAKEIFRAIIDAGEQAYIPFDNRLMVMEG